MSSTAERIPKEAQGAERVAQLYAREIAENGITFVRGVYWREGSDIPVVITIDSTASQRCSGSGTVQESDFNKLRMVRSTIAGRLQQGCDEVSILYRAGMVSIPDNGPAKIATLVEGYQRVEE